MRESQSFHSDGFHPQEQQWIEELIESVHNDPFFDHPSEFLLGTENFPFTEKVRDRFFSLLRTPGYTPREGTVSLGERWALQEQRRDWLSNLQDRLQSIKQSHVRAWQELQPFFHSLQSIIEVLSQRMIPAPAHRSAAVSQDHVSQEQLYKPRRRSIEPADLPAFSPLFCTALGIEAEPFHLSGLKPITAYTLKLLSLQHPEVSHEEVIHTNEQGTCEIDFAGLLTAHQKQGDARAEFVWFLGDATGEGTWGSGLIWLESKATRKLADDTIRVLLDSSDPGKEDACIHTLFEINMLATREFFMEAYEQARQGLLFLPRQYRDENMVPFKESLWLFIHHLMGKIIQRLEKAEPVFRRVKPDWNAVASLKELQLRLEEWE